MPNVIMVRNEYPDEQSLKNVIRYVLGCALRGGYGIDPEMAFEQMKFVKQSFHKSSGVQLKHFIISFSNREMIDLDFSDLLALGFRVGQHLREYQLVYGIHLDSDHVHIHFAMNTVSFLDGHKFADGLLPFRRLCSLLSELFPKSQVHLCQTGPLSRENPYTPEQRGVFQILT